MSVNKVKHEYKTILDFSDQNVTRVKVKRTLNSVDIAALYQLESNNLFTSQMICVENEIKVGMYKICIALSPAIQRITNHKLKDFGDFTIQIYELGKECKEINLKRDNRFRDQYWVQKNNSGLKVIDLTDIVCHCNRLDRVKAFL